MKLKKTTDKIEDINLLKILYIIISFTFVLPSIMYMYKYKTVLRFNKEFNFLLDNASKIKQTIIYLIIITMFILLYFLIIKKRKQLFKNIKSAMIFILITSSIFVFVIPFLSSDVFYYLGTGRLSSEYGQNPYYVSMNQFVNENPNIEFKNDTALLQGYNNYWAKTTVVYGPISTIICEIIAKLSLGNVDFGLLIFKIANLIVHMLNCWFLYKISKKKIFTLLYGLNPFILLEGIVNVHNDMFAVLFLLIALYFLIKKKKILLSIIFLGLATCIKYFTILLLPFFIIYYYRKEKPITRISACIKYGLIFAIVIVIPYTLYIQDFSVFEVIWKQQDIVANSLYLVLSQHFDGMQIIIKYLLYIYISLFALKNILLLFNSKIKLKKEMKYNLYLIMVLIFVLMTNFHPWYIMWLFPLIIWQKSSNIKLIVQIGLISMYANSVYGVYLYLALITGIILAAIYDNRKFFLMLKNRLIKKTKKENGI